MNTKNFICILASAALLVSCAQTSPMGKLVPMGKRTEEAGKVIDFSAQQIKLQCTDGTGTWLVTRTPTLTIIGSLTVGSTVTVKDSPWLTQVPATN